MSPSGAPLQDHLRRCRTVAGNFYARASQGRQRSGFIQRYFNGKPVSLDTMKRKLFS